MEQRTSGKSIEDVRPWFVNGTARGRGAWGTRETRASGSSVQPPAERVMWVTLVKSYVAIWAIVSSCGSDHSSALSKEIYVIQNQDSTALESHRPLDSLLVRAINHGDTSSYEKASRIFMMYPNRHDYFFYSMLMANKHHYSLAYWDSYAMMNSRITINDIHVFSNDSISQAFRLSLLQSAADYGSVQALWVIADSLRPQ